MWSVEYSRSFFRDQQYNIIIRASAHVCTYARGAGARAIAQAQNKSRELHVSIVDTLDT